MRKRYLKYTLTAFMCVFCAWVLSAHGAVHVAEHVAQPITKTIDKYETPFDTQDYMIAYDSAPALWYPGYTEEGAQFAVRFTPEQACSLKYFHVASFGDALGEIEFHIWDSNEGLPGDDIVTPFEDSIDGNVSFQRIDLSSAIDMGTSDFFIGCKILNTDSPTPTSDQDGSTTNRSMVKLSSGNWFALDNDFNIRACVAYYGEDTVGPQILHDPIEMDFTQGSAVAATAEVTDNSGVSSVTMFYDNGGGYTSVAMSNTTGDTYSVNLPDLTAGDTVNYYIRAVDNSSSNNARTYPAGGASDPLTYVVIAGADLGYDDGSAEGWWIVGESYRDNAFAVKCTPSDYPATITMVRAYVDDTTEFEFGLTRVLGDDELEFVSGLSGSATAGSVPGWVNVSLPTPSIIEENFFYVVFHWDSNEPYRPAVGGDDDSPDSNSYWRTDSTWTQTTELDLMLRAVVELPTPTGVEEYGAPIPEDYSLEQNFPNPFNSSTYIPFNVVEDSEVEIKVYNLAGQLIDNLYEGQCKPGHHVVKWNADSYASGVYFYRLSVGDKVFARKMNLLK
ncbi:MAG: T9SS type A sorting domain-containing protein [candidate division Zixibacteria bacterium]|nr:T9SS type A sorting domain-containing protein [candidate division Zixibacteria bacterium]